MPVGGGIHHPAANHVRRRKSLIMGGAGSVEAAAAIPCHGGFVGGSRAVDEELGPSTVSGIFPILISIFQSQDPKLLRPLRLAHRTVPAYGKDIRLPRCHLTPI